MACSLDMASDSVTELDGSSDTVWDSPCKPCTGDDKYTEGVWFCFQCQTCFCQTCVGHHNKCFKAHSLFYKLYAKSKNVQQQSELMCDKHPGNPIQMYCGEHDVVSCAVCVAVDHRLCRGVDYIPKLATEILNGRDRKDVKTSLERLERELMAAKASKLEEISKVKSENDGILNKVSTMTERIVSRVMKLEKATVSEVKRRYDDIVNKIRNDIQYLDDMLATTGRQIEKVEQFKGDNEAKLFVLLNKAHGVESDCKIYLETNSKVLYDKISFQIDHGIESALNGVKSLEFSEGAGLSLVGKYNVRFSENENNCCIIDSCTLDDGQIVIADCGNNMLKRLDETYNLKDWLDVSCLGGVCRTGPNELAVISSNTVQFVHVGKSMVGSHAFTIFKGCIQREGVIPSGYSEPSVNIEHIVYDDEKLYISMKAIYSEEWTSLVLIYDRKGSHLRTILTSLKENEGVSNFSVSSDGSHLHFATSEGLITVNSKGSVVSKVTDIRLKDVSHVTEGDNGQLYICSRDSGNVFLLDKDGTIDEVLGRYDGIDYPQCILYIKNQKRLLVACYGQNTVKIFQSR